MGSEGHEKETVVTQVSFGGFGKDVTAQELSFFLEEELSVLVWRCRLKTSWTPLDSYPDFQVIQIDNIRRTSDYTKVVPHAFVHLDSASSVKWVLDAVGSGPLFLGDHSLKVSMGPENPFRMNQRRRTTVPFKLTNVSLDVGTLISKEEFLVAWSSPTKDADFLVDPFDGMCRVQFKRDIAFAFMGHNKHAVIQCDFKLEFPTREVNMVRQYRGRSVSSLVVLFQLASSPLLSYRTAEDDIYAPVSFSLLDDDDPWIRTTDFTPNGAIGRCSSYRIDIPPRNGPHLEKALKYLKERRVPYEHYGKQLRVNEEPTFSNPSLDPFFCIQNIPGLSFDVRFMLNAVLHKGIINQHQLSDKFFNLLRVRSHEVSMASLKHIYSYKHPVFDAARRLEIVQNWLMENPKMLKLPKTSIDLVEIRRLIITPTKAYCLPPDVEISNRVLRHYNHVSDRFLRVTFMDEGMQRLNANVLTFFAAPIVKEITNNSYLQKTTGSRRIYSILNQGFRLCGRKYYFLAFSANQLRDQSAWFFAEDETDKKLKVNNIRAWMGRFDNKNVAKCAARMGQCFSSTYATVKVPPSHVVELEDVKRNGYVFSDGIGMITPDLASKMAEKLQLRENPPCAYQIRFAGSKGVVVCWPQKEVGEKLYLRPSMIKFSSSHSVLEVCSWTRFQPGFLNRQIVTLLSALYVPDEVFWRMQETMTNKLNDMFQNAEAAFDVLMESCAEQGNTAAIMLSSGFKPQTEPHLRGMLTCIRAGQLRDLREKARIYVPKGRWLMGCFDELGVLEHGQCFIQVSLPSLENTFHKHGARFSVTKNNLRVIKGLVIIAKNPCLHPGDIRVLEAVDVPDLHHLFDCVVFPQNGDRPHANEASGSDLDGDLYFVAWDDNLIPPSKQSWEPMDYTAVAAKELRRDVTTKDIIEFFTRNMVNEHLGTICNAHVVHADTSEYGALDKNCLQLAELAAVAVDFPKTGKLAMMPYELKPKLYPDFMGKPDWNSYKSEKILGRLYRRIKDTLDEEDITAASSAPIFGPEEVPFDQDLQVLGYEDFQNEAWDLKCSYERQLDGLLCQYKVNHEEEIVTGHVWSMPRHSSKKQGELKEKMRHAYSALKKEFRLRFDMLGTEEEHLSSEVRNVLYEKKASAWYVVTYHPEWVNRSMTLRGIEVDERETRATTVMRSFAWIAVDYLARIKVRKGGKGSDADDESKPINALSKFLALRI